MRVLPTEVLTSCVSKAGKGGNEITAGADRILEEESEKNSGVREMIMRVAKKHGRWSEGMRKLS